MLKAQAAKENEIKQHILNGPQKRLIKRHTPPIQSNPLRSQQSPTSNQTTQSNQNRIPLPANVPSTLQFLSLQQRASSLMNSQGSTVIMEKRFFIRIFASIDQLILIK